MLQIIKKVEEILRKPHNEAKHMKCIVTKIDDATKEEKTITLHKDEVDLIETLNHIQQGAKLYAPTMNEIWMKIEKYGRMKYEQGCYDTENINF